MYMQMYEIFHYFLPVFLVFVVQSYIEISRLPKEKREKFVTYVKIMYLCTQ